MNVIICSEFADYANDWACKGSVIFRRLLQCEHCDLSIKVTRTNIKQNIIIIIITNYDTRFAAGFREDTVVARARGTPAVPQYRARSAMPSHLAPWILMR